MGTFPGSLSEGAAERSEAEGVSFDGSTGPMIYTPVHINSEIFERLRSPKYTPSVSLSLDSSLREGAGMGCVPFNVPPGNRNVSGDFHRPYETQKILAFTIQRTTLPQSRIRSTAPSEREPGAGCTIQRVARKPEGYGRFSSPLRRLRMFYISPFIGRHSLTGNGFGCGRRWGFGGRLF